MQAGHLMQAGLSRDSLPLPAVFKVEKNVDNTLVKPRDPHRLLDTHRLHFHSDQVGTGRVSGMFVTPAWQWCLHGLHWLSGESCHHLPAQPAPPHRICTPAGLLLLNRRSPLRHTAPPGRLCLQGATDLIALLSLSAAKEGGDSKWVSSLAIHNELLRRGRKVSPPARLFFDVPHGVVS